MKITTGFNPVEANFLLQMCYHHLQAGDSSGHTPKIPVTIPQPEGWGLWKCSKPTSNAVGFCIWQNEINRQQFALILHGPALTVSELTSSEFSRMSDANLTMYQQQHALCQHPSAKCNTRFLNEFEQLYPSLFSAITELPISYELYLSGHGFGAGLASLALCIFHKKALSPSFPAALKTYLFGSPKIGNAIFANYLNELSFNNSKIDSLTFKIQNSQDLICELPQTIGLHPKLQGSVKSLRQRFLHSINRLLYPGQSSAHSEPYTHFGTPVILPKLTANNSELSREHQHDLRHYFQLLNEHYPI